MQKSKRDEYVETALDMLKEAFAQEGVILREVSTLPNALIAIGKLYHALEQLEDLP